MKSSWYCAVELCCVCMHRHQLDIIVGDYTELHLTDAWAYHLLGNFLEDLYAQILIPVHSEHERFVHSHLCVNPKFICQLPDINSCAF